MVKKKNREPAFGSAEYFLLWAKRHRLRALIEDDPMKRKEYLSRANACEYHFRVIRSQVTR